MTKKKLKIITVLSAITLLLSTWGCVHKMANPTYDTNNRFLTLVPKKDSVAVHVTNIALEALNPQYGHITISCDDDSTYTVSSDTIAYHPELSYPNAQCLSVGDTVFVNCRESLAWHLFSGLLFATVIVSLSVLIAGLRELREEG